MKLALALAVALAAALVVLLVALSANTSVEHSRPAAFALGAPAAHAITIGTDPVGLSVEYQLLARELGDGSCPPAALVRAIRGLGEPALRIGGDSQDETAPAGTAPHAGVSDLPAGFWLRLACLERETAVRVIVGLNLASGEPGWAATLAADARAAIPSTRLGFELGNEADIYGSHVPWWNGRTLVHTRMPFATYLARARALASEIGPGAAIEGPDFASGRWIDALPQLARTLHLTALDAHFYPLDACRGDAGVNAAALLSRATQLKLDERVRVARDAAAAGLPALISEANSISCGGLAGVSDSAAAAVWAARLVLVALRSGFDSVRFHSSGGAYDPFVVRGGTLTLRPLYAGLRAVAELLPVGATLRSVPAPRTLDAFAVAGASGRIYILSNYAAAATVVTVPVRTSSHAGADARVVAIVPGTPTVRTWRAAVTGGRARVSLPAGSLVAITAAAG